jgi:hypothetical protein
MTHHKMMRPAMALLGSLLLVGCDEGWQAETYPVAGKVLINGQPAAEAVVELHSVGTQPDSRNSRPWGVVQPDGTYQLTTYGKDDGAPPGEYAVTLRWPSDLSSPSHFDRLAGAFDSPETAPLQVTIRPEENTLPTVELTGAKVLPAKKPVAGNIRKTGPGPRMAN